jgi:hypothetical protein
MATMLLNLAWALGETLGAPAAANISQATSDAVPLLLLSGIMVLTLLPVIKARLFATGAEHPAAPAPAHAPDRTPDQHRTPDHHGAPEQAPASTR